MSRSWSVTGAEAWARRGFTARLIIPLVGAAAALLLGAAAAEALRVPAPGADDPAQGAAAAADTPFQTIALANAEAYPAPRPAAPAVKESASLEDPSDAAPSEAVLVSDPEAEPDAASEADRAATLSDAGPTDGPGASMSEALSTSPRAPAPPPQTD